MFAELGAFLLCLLSRLHASHSVTRESYSRIALGKVILPQSYSTHKASCIAVSTKLASLIGLLEPEAKKLDRTVEFLFQPDTVKLQMRPDIPPGVPGYIIELKIKSILVLPSLLTSELFISSKIHIPLLTGFDLNALKWISTMEVKHRREGLQDFGAALLAAGEYHLYDCEGRYYYVRRFIKRLFENFKNNLVTIQAIENKIDSLKFDRLLVQLTSDQLEDLWEDSLKYYTRYCSAIIKIKWILYMVIGKKIQCNPIYIFGPIDVLVIAETILKDKAAINMIEFLEESDIIGSFKNNVKKSLAKSIRKQNFMDSPKLAILTINIFREVYTLKWIRSDILSLIVLSSTKKRQWLKTSAVQEFLQVMTEDYHGYVSQKWLKAFLRTIKIFKIQPNVEEWQSCGLFGVYLWILYSHVPEFFMHVEWRTFKDQEKNQYNPFNDLKDAVLEMSALVPCLTLKKTLNSPKFPVRDVSKIIKSAITRFMYIDTSSLAKEGFKNMMMAIDYWLQVTEFCDAIVLLNQDPEMRPTETARVAIILGQEIMRAFQHFVGLQRQLYYDPTYALRMLSKLKTSRVSLILIWSKAVSLPQDTAFLVNFANNDLYGLAYAVWASRLIDQLSLKALLESGSDAISRSGNDFEAFIQLYNSLGEKVEDLCGQEAVTHEVVWHLPACIMDDSITLESSVALIRIYLLLKFGVPFGVTRSHTTLASTDTILPFEFAHFMNFWLDRHYALKCHLSKKSACKPPYKIIIEVAEEPNQKQ